ncbi:hypothetical protein AC249_AIPGENE24542 [Exaiptasia diaphana]|nr:hypothetical protein AC249_AIPGENE24542 [Exaiptasia diaphana]
MKYLILCSIMTLLVLTSIPSYHAYAAGGAILHKGKKRDFIQSKRAADAFCTMAKRHCKREMDIVPPLQ